MFSGSKKEILDLFKRKGPLSIDQVTEHTGLAKTTLREHMLQLERDLYIARSYKRTGRGRPVLVYALTEQGQQLYPSSEPDVLQELLLYLKHNNQEPLIASFFREFWYKRLEKARGFMNQANENEPESRLAALRAMLEQEGFMPEVTNNPETGELIIRECNCPYSELLSVSRLPCQLEEQFYQKLFGSNVQRTSYIADGEPSCTYVIKTTP